MRPKNYSTLPGIYAIVHIASGRRYIGSSINMTNRWQAHRKTLNANRHHCPYLQNSWNKHGKAAFRFEVLETCLNEPTILVAREQFWMDRFAKNLFNAEKIADVSSREWHSMETGKAAHETNRIKAIKRWKDKPYHEGICIRCGKTFRSRGDIPKQFCSGNCITRTRVASGKERQTRVCQFCGKDFVVQQKAKRAKTCSTFCRVRLKSPLSASAVMSICERVAKGESMAAIAPEYNVDRKTIEGVAKRERWEEVELPPEVETALAKRFSVKNRFPAAKMLLTPAQITEIRERLKTGEHQGRMAKEYGISPATLSEIKNGNRYKADD